MKYLNRIDTDNLDKIVVITWLISIAVSTTITIYINLVAVLAISMLYLSVTGIILNIQGDPVDTCTRILFVILVLYIIINILITVYFIITKGVFESFLLSLLTGKFDLLKVLLASPPCAPNAWKTLF